VIELYESAIALTSDDARREIFTANQAVAAEELARIGYACTDGD
jgi:hypothetical protein